MTTFFTMQEKPQKSKNFFENYTDHVRFLFDKYKQVIASENFSGFIDNIAEASIKSLNLFEPLRDGHDYFDEVGGATAIPLASAVASIATFAMAAWEGLQALACSVGFMRSSTESHADEAVKFLQISLACALLALGSFVKSAVSLVTRPLVTAIKGFAPQDKERFMIDDSVQSHIEHSM